MYLYFDKLGTLKEIINDEALRQGNYGVNKIYVYCDNGLDGVTSKDYSSIDVSYLLPSNTIVGPQNHNTFENSQIPFDAKRDLRFFKYNQTYHFCVIELEADPGETEDTYGASPLDETGVVHCEMTLNLTSGGAPVLGEVNFEVAENAVLNQKYVAEEEYLSLANYQFLRKLIAGDLPIFGYLPLSAGLSKPLTGDLYFDGRRAIFSGLDEDLEIIGYAGGRIGVKSSSNYGAFYLTSQLTADREFIFPNKNGTFAMTSDLPSQGVCCVFSTGDFTLDDDHYVATNLVISNFITGSNMLIISWDNCFALCPIPQSGAGRVVAAMWDSSGEAKTIRVRYELKENNTKLDINLQGGFTPPADHTAYVQCIKLF